jgi:hypothetical protein
LIDSKFALVAEKYKHPNVDLAIGHLLASQEAAALIAAHQGAEPAQLAVDLRRQHPELSASLLTWVATQVELRAKALTKLPSWAAANCRFERTALEQCTSEAASTRKAELYGRGEHAIDLTAGLGVDTWALANRYTRVTAIEADAERAELLRHNLRQLGITNVTVVCADALSWLAACERLAADVIYADPGRRRSTAGARSHALAALLPDPRVITRLAAARAHRLLLKLSPLYDLAEAWREWPTAAEVAALSVAGEVKEVLVNLPLSRASTEQTLVATGDSYHFAVAKEDWGTAEPAERSEARYVLLPDAALVKARLDAHWMAAHAPSAGLTCTGGFWLADAVPEGLAGRALVVDEVVPYKPAQIRAALTAEGIRYASVLVRGAGIPGEQVRRDLGLTDGGDVCLLVTQTRSGRVCVRCRRLASPA